MLVKVQARELELTHLRGDFLPVMIIDTAIDPTERMRPAVLEVCRKRAAELGIGFYYVSQEREFADEPPLPEEGTAGR